MEKEVLDIIAENLTNERLDDIAFQNEEYICAEKETDRKQNLLEEMLDEEQCKLFEEYLSAENHRMAVYTGLSVTVQPSASLLRNLPIPDRLRRGADSLLARFTRSHGLCSQCKVLG